MDKGEENSYLKPLELFKQQKDYVKIAAPMVRYSKIQFRQLVRKYDCDLVYTPMIISNSFIQSSKARDVEFTTNKSDRPLIVQFAANNSNDFATAAQFVYPYCDGVDLNCGCPQQWAKKEGLGAVLINKADLICEIVKETRKRLNYDNEFTISAKIRIHDKIENTIDLCRKLESAGCSYLTVHARTAKERHEPIHLDYLKIIKETIKQIPIIANGDLFTINDCNKIKAETNVDGCMSARGLLENPALFAGYTQTPVSCIRDWVDISLEYGTSFQYFHQVLVNMLENVLSKSERRYFSSLISTTSVIDYLNENIFSQ